MLYLFKHENFSPPPRIKFATYLGVSTHRLGNTALHSEDVRHLMSFCSQGKLCSDWIITWDAVKLH
jgi:hypothetical protein